MRTRDYYRKMRTKHIRRKRRIESHYHDSDKYSIFKHPGQYSKGKIHCSCSWCKSKAYYGKHVPSIKDKKREHIDCDCDIDT